MVSVRFSLAGLKMKTQIVICITSSGQQFLVTETSLFNRGKIVIVLCALFRRNNDGPAQSIITKKVGCTAFDHLDTFDIVKIDIDTPCSFKYRYTVDNHCNAGFFTHIHLVLNPSDMYF